MMNLISNFWVWFIFKVLPVITTSDYKTCNGIPNKTECCKECPDGTFKFGVDQCKGTVLWRWSSDQESWELEDPEMCQECVICDSHINQIEESPCTPTKNRVCRCKDGHYGLYGELQICVSCQECKTQCPGCSVTQGPNGTAVEPICQTQDCKKPECSHTLQCETMEEPPDGGTNILVVVIVLFTLLLGLLLIWHVVHCGRKACWTAKEKPTLPGQQNGDTYTTARMPYATDSVLDQMIISIPPEIKEMNAFVPVLETSIQPSQETQMDTYTPSLNRSRLEKHSTSPTILSSQHPYLNYEAQVLYTIIREVPVRRWKEFLRLLSVPDEEIERVEMEPGASYLERQYQMLRLWCQGDNVNLESIYSTLHSMDLSGCADKLQHKLQRILQTNS